MSRSQRRRPSISAGKSLSLFDHLTEPNRSAREASSGSSALADRGRPLAERMRPSSLAQVVGQEEVLGEHGFLRRAIAADRVPSLVFWGPPGSGKTTLARIIAQETSSHFLPFSAATSGIKEIKAVMAEAERLRRSRSVFLFVDEIHRFNRAQQDAFLPYVERGDVVLVGATTENPSFELNGSLLSRCRVVVLEPIGLADLVRLLKRALEDREYGFGELEIEVKGAALEAIAQLASGDARRALSLLELVVEGDDGESPERRITTSDVERASQGKVLLYDKSGEEHFNLISALHKSLRESDPQAALYWLSRMLESGEEPTYVARRMVRFASEDVGLADPMALSHSLAAWDAYHRLGSPEGHLALAQAAVYLALAPKSVALYRAESAVKAAIQERPAEPVPHEIRNAPTALMKELGYGDGYRYAPDTAERLGGLECLPESLRGERFYHPSREGFEAELAARLEEIERRRKKARADPSAV